MALGNDADDDSSNADNYNKTAAVSFTNPLERDVGDDGERYFEAMDWLKGSPLPFSRPTVVGELVWGVYQAVTEDDPEDLLITVAAVTAQSTDPQDLHEVIDGLDEDDSDD